MKSSSNTIEFEELVAKNRYGIRHMQTKYFQNEYERAKQIKNQKLIGQMIEKDQQHSMVKELNNNYLNQLSSQRLKKLREKQHLSIDYQDQIRQQNDRNRYQKQIQKNVEKSSLAAPTWIRDVFTQRETHKKNIDSYSRALNDHVRIQQIRKGIQKAEQAQINQKIDLQAQQLLKKEYQYLQARHRQKSLFQKRQNELLGIHTDIYPQIGNSSFHDKSVVLKRKEQEIYSQGLEVQLRRERQRRQISDKSSVNLPNIYNPISNPIPFVYKNPNVLRMLAQN